MDAELLGAFQQKETCLSFVDGSAKEGVVKMDFIVVRLENKYYYVRSIDDRLLPQARGRLLMEKEFITSFTPDPAFFFQCLHPTMISLRKRIQTVGGNIKSLSPNAEEKRILGLLQLADVMEGPNHNGFVLALKLAVSVPLTVSAARHFLVHTYTGLATKLHEMRREELAVQYLRHALGLDPADKKVLSFLRELYSSPDMKNEKGVSLKQVG